MTRAIDTEVIHAGRPRERVGGAVTMPIFQATVFELEDLGSYPDLRYIRYANLPDIEALCRRLAALEGAERAVLAASGMGAIAGTLLTFLSAGDHVVAADGLYGGSHAVLSEDLPRFDVAVDRVPLGDVSALEAALRPETRLVYCESIANPLMNVPDLVGIADLARRHGLLSVVDNTFASPVNLRPLELGFDLSLHSATKYLNGHSDLVAGVVTGSSELVGRVEATLRRLGPSIDPHVAFLLGRGLKTLVLRVRRQNASALHLAEFLERQPLVGRVLYPGLPSHPDHARARELLEGFGGMLSFEVDGGAEAAAAFLGALEVVIHAPSLGGVESLAVLPARSSHAGLSSEDRARLGIGEGLIRLSVGIEALEDLESDLVGGLAMLAGA